MAKLEELTTGAEAQFGDRHGAIWLRLDYDVRMAKKPDPQVEAISHKHGVLITQRIADRTSIFHALAVEH